MLRTSRKTLSVVVTGLSFAVAVGGCAALFDIEDSSDRGGGSGGAGGGGGSSTGTSMGALHSGLDCFDKAPPPPNPGCSGQSCPATVMASSKNFAYALTTNGKAVFWSVITDNGNPGHTEIYRVEHDTVEGVEPILMTNFDGGVFVMAADCEYLYFAIGGVLKPSIKRVPIDAVNQDTQEEIVLGADAYGVTAMAASDPYLFFAVTVPGGSELRAWRKGTPEIRTVDSPRGAVTGLVVRDKRVYWIDEGSNLKGPGQLKGVDFPPPGGMPGGAWPPPQLIRSAVGVPQSLAVDESNVYWVDVRDSKLEANLKKAPNKLAMNGEPDPEELATLGVLTTSQLPANWLSVDGQSVYFRNKSVGGIGHILRVNKGMPPYEVSDVLISNDFNIHGFVADGSRLYVSVPSDTNSQLLWVAK